ncbi:MerR family transcriptional regulator [Paenibacillaceae bacterium WGS1546]|uniref:MerR family transcriptional regulator n=1 Tax=Cohnella sp. WGS1546 TaxID=3366810 RepID=UPI00372D5EC9
MRTDRTFTIGQIAKLCGLSVQTLRYYDKIGLVERKEVDRQTGYRYYSNLNLLELKIVQDMKALRFSLDEIRRSLNDKDLAGLIALMKGKREETLREIRKLESIVSSVGERIGQMAKLEEIGERLSELDTLVELKTLPDRFVASDRRRAACGLEHSVLRFAELFGKLEAHQLVQSGYMMTVYHENILTFDRNDSDLELCIPVQGDGSGLPFVRRVEGGEYATALYAGIPNFDCRNFELVRRKSRLSPSDGYSIRLFMVL